MKANAQIALRPGIVDRITQLLLGTDLRDKVDRITHLEQLSYRLQVKAMSLPRHATARAFTPILERAAAMHSRAWDFLSSESNGRKVLVDNAYLKVVMVRWEPGAGSDRHFHPNGGGMILVLEGSVQESRFHQATSAVPHEVLLLGPQAMSYIDDTLGAHAVMNPNPFHAVTLHAYLKDRLAGTA